MTNLLLILCILKESFLMLIMQHKKKKVKGVRVGVKKAAGFKV